MKKIILFLFTALLLISVRSSALNVTIIESPNYSYDMIWKGVCQGMGHTATIYPYTKLNLIGNLSATDILIVSEAKNDSLDAPRTNVIKQYLQNGGKAYIQSEYSDTFPGNVAYKSLVNSLGGTFNWAGLVDSELVPMTILGSMATDYAVTSPLRHFHWGQIIDPCSTVEMFLQYEGNYYGSIFCVPASSGRVVTCSDQDWVGFYMSLPECDSMLKNIIYNLAKTSYNCVNYGGNINANLGNDTTICSGDFLVLTPGLGYAGYLWQNGQTTPSIIVDSTGTYWVNVSSACATSASDTIHVTVIASPTTPNITQSGDTLFCSFNVSYTSYQWYDDSTLISGATNPYLVISHGGNYNVKVTGENGCAVAAGKIINGIKQFYVYLNISLYPDPAGNKLFVKGYTLTRKSTLKIYNALGEICQQSEITRPQSEIDVSALSSGMYFVQLTDETNQWTGKFVKQ